MIIFLIFLMIIVSILLMGVVLMQSSKGNGLAGPIGGSSVTMAFGVRRTSDLLTKSTTILAAVLMVGSIAINLMIGSGTVDESIIQKNSGQQQQMPPPSTTPPIETPPPTENNTQQQQQQQESKEPVKSDQNQNKQPLQDTKGEGPDATQGDHK